MEMLGLISDGELFAVDVSLVAKVARCIPYTPVPALPDAVAGIASMKGGIITLISLSALLCRTESAPGTNAVIFKAMTNGNDQMGLLVDNPESLISIDVEDIRPPYHSEDGECVSFISGLVEVGEKLYRIIDIDLLTKRLIG